VRNTLTLPQRIAAQPGLQRRGDVFRGARGLHAELELHRACPARQHSPRARREEDHGATQGTHLHRGSALILVTGCALVLNNSLSTPTLNKHPTFDTLIAFRST